MNKKEQDQPGSSRREASFPGFTHGSGGFPIPSIRRVGTATMVTGTVTVPDTSVTANSIIIITPQDSGALAGITRVSARVVGTSFTISSLNIADTATVGYIIVEP